MACCRRTRALSHLQGLQPIITNYPLTIAWPLLLFAVLCGIGLWSTRTGAHDAAENFKTHAISLAADAAIGYRQQLAMAFAPTQVLVAMVLQQPQYSAISALFNATAAALSSTASPHALQALELIPAGVIRLVYPSAGNENLQGVDLLGLPDPVIKAAMSRSLADRALSLDGPLPPLGNASGPVLVVRQAIFVPVGDPNETFGLPDSPNPVCGAVCGYNATNGTKFWGFAAGLIQLDRSGGLVPAAGSLSPLQTLERLGYRYSLTAPGPDGTDLVVSSSEEQPVDPVKVDMELLPNVVWVLRVSPRSGSWMPAWYGGVLAAVVVASLAASTMLFSLLVSRRRHQMLLAALLPRELIRDLQSENAGALGPRKLQADSPAELLLGLLGQLLSGRPPDLRDVVLLRTVLQQHRDVYRPLNITERIKDAKLDGEVASALIRQLGDASDLTPASRWSSQQGGGPGGGPALARALLQSPSGRASNGDLRQLLSAARQREAQLQSECQGLHGALAFIMSPEAGGAGSGTGGTLAGEEGCMGRRTSLPRPRSAMLMAGDDILPVSGAHTPASVAANDDPGSARTSCVLTNSAMLGGLAISVCQQQHQHQHQQHQHQQQPHNNAGSCRVSTSGMYLRMNLAGGESCASASGGASTSRCFVVMPEGPGCGPGGGTVAAPNVDAATAVAGRGTSSSHASGTDQGLRLGERLLEGGASLLQGRLGRVRRKSAGPVVGDRGSPRCGQPNDSATFFKQSASGVLRGALSLAAPQVAVVMAPPRPLVEEVERLLAGSDGWQFDTWALQESSGGHALSCMGFYLIQRAGLTERFRLEPLRLARFLRAVESGYSAANPYHNSIHAADVLRNLHVLLHGSRLVEHYLDSLGLLAAYFAAVVHDFEHGGVTNDFLVSTQHPLALRYNDRCPLESHHCAAAFGLMAERPELDVTAGMSRQERAAFRKQVIELVLATDMKQHFATITRFNTVHRLAPEPQQGAATATADLAQRALSRSASHKADSGSGSPVHDAPVPLDEAERLLSLQMALKVSDLGHLGAELEAHKRWLGLLEEEFFRQGDQERLLGLPISPLCDRTKQGVSKSQVGFFSFVALPLVSALAAAFPGAAPLLRCFQSNYDYWREVEGAAASPQTSPRPAAAAAATAPSAPPPAAAPSAAGLRVAVSRSKKDVSRQTAAAKDAPAQQVTGVEAV